MSRHEVRRKLLATPNAVVSKGLGEWARQESNLRLPPCEDGTLAAELRAHQRQGFVTRRSDQWVP